MNRFGVVVARHDQLEYGISWVRKSINFELVALRRKQ